MPEYTIQELEAFRLKKLIAQELKKNQGYEHYISSAEQALSVNMNHHNRIARNKGKWRRK